MMRLSMQGKKSDTVKVFKSASPNNNDCKNWSAKDDKDFQDILTLASNKRTSTSWLHTIMVSIVVFFMAQQSCSFDYNTNDSFRSVQHTFELVNIGEKIVSLQLGLVEAQASIKRLQQELDKQNKKLKIKKVPMKEEVQKMNGKFEEDQESESHSSKQQGVTQFSIRNDCPHAVDIDVHYTSGIAVVNTYHTTVQHNESIDFIIHKSLAFALISANHNNNDIYVKKCDGKDAEFVIHDGHCSRYVYPNMASEIFHLLKCKDSLQTLPLDTSDVVPTTIPTSIPTSIPTKISTNFPTNILIGNDCPIPVDIKVYHANGEDIAHKYYSDIEQNRSINFTTQKSISFALIGVSRDNMDLFGNKCATRETGYIMHGEYCSKLVYPNMESEITHSVTCNIAEPIFPTASSAAAPTSVPTRFVIGNDCLLPININVFYTDGENIVKKNYSDMKQSESITFAAQKSIAFALVGALQNDVDLYIKKCEARDPEYTMHGGYCYKVVYPSRQFEITHFFV